MIQAALLTQNGVDMRVSIYRPTLARWLSALGFSLVLVACGGGGSSVGSIPSGQPNSAISGVTTLNLLAGNPTVTGQADGVGSAARFNEPTGIAADSAGNVYVVDTSIYAGSRSIVRKITPDAAVTSPNQGGFSVASDNLGNVYFGGSSVYKVKPDDSSIEIGRPIVCGGPQGGPVLCSDGLPLVTALAADRAGNVYAASRSAIYKITPDKTQSIFAGAGVSGSDDGVGNLAKFNYILAIATDGAGNVYASDSNHTIRKITPAGVVSTLAGKADFAGYTDGVGSEARFFYPNGITADGAGNVYVADTSNQIVRKITPSGVVTTVVGKAGAEGVYLTALPATLSRPRGVALSGDKLYITTASSVVWVYVP